MAWFKIDDKLITSQKVLMIPRSLRPTALGVWTLCGTWSAHAMSDGFVPDHVLDEYGCTDEVRHALLFSGLWDDAEGGIEFHDWCDYQPTRAELEAKRDAVSAKRADAAKKRWDTSCKPDANAIQTDANRMQNDAPNPNPNPNLTTPKGVEEKAHRIPTDFEVTESMAQWAQREFPNTDIRRETEAFVDYWTALPGAKALKKDWPATWRMWIRRSRPATPARTTAVERNLSVVQQLEAMEFQRLGVSA